MTLEPGINQNLSAAINSEVSRVTRLFSVPPSDIERAILTDNLYAEVRNAMQRRLGDLLRRGATLDEVIDEFNGSTKFLLENK